MAGVDTERRPTLREMQLDIQAQSRKRHAILMRGEPVDRPPRSLDGILQALVKTPITPLGVFAAFEANKDRNGGKFVSPVTSVLFPPEKTERNKDITTEVLIEDRIKGDPRGIKSVNWGVIPAETVAGLIAEVAFEANNSNDKLLALDADTKYTTLGGRFGKSLETLGQYVMEELGVGSDEALPFLLKDLGLLKDQSAEEDVAVPGNGHRPGLGATADFVPDAAAVTGNGGVANGHPASGETSLAAEAERPSASQRLTAFVKGVEDTEIGDHIQEAIAIAGAMIAQSNKIPDQRVDVVLPREQFAPLIGLTVDGDPVLDVIASAIAEHSDREFFISVAPAEPAGNAGTVTSKSQSVPGSPSIGTTAGEVQSAGGGASTRRRGGRPAISVDDTLAEVVENAALHGGVLLGSNLTPGLLARVMKLGGVPAVRERLGLKEPPGGGRRSRITSRPQGNADEDNSQQKQSKSPWRRSDDSGADAAMGRHRGHPRPLTGTEYKRRKPEEGPILQVPAVTIFDDGYQQDPALSGVSYGDLVAATASHMAAEIKAGRSEQVPGSFNRDLFLGDYRVYVTNASHLANCATGGRSPKDMNVRAPQEQEEARGICIGCRAATICFAEAAQRAITALDNAPQGANAVKVVGEAVPGVRAGRTTEQLVGEVTRWRPVTEVYIEDVAEGRPVQDAIHQELAGLQTVPKSA